MAKELSPLLQVAIESDHKNLQHDTALILGVIHILTECWREELHIYGWLPEQTQDLAQQVLQRYKEKINQ